MPPLHLFVFQLVCVSLGIARGALDELGELAQSKTPSLYTQVLADKAVAQVELARCEAALGAARSFLYETVDDMWQTVSSGRTPTKRQLALGRIAAIHGVETGAVVTRTANTLGGGSSLIPRRRCSGTCVTRRPSPTISPSRPTSGKRPAASSWAATRSRRILDEAHLRRGGV